MHSMRFSNIDITIAFSCSTSAAIKFMVNRRKLKGKSPLKDKFEHYSTQVAPEFSWNTLHCSCSPLSWYNFVACIIFLSILRSQQYNVPPSPNRQVGNSVRQYWTTITFKQLLLFLVVLCFVWSIIIICVWTLLGNQWQYSCLPAGIICGFRSFPANYLLKYSIHTLLTKYWGKFYYYSCFTFDVQILSNLISSYSLVHYLMQ